MGENRFFEEKVIINQFRCKDGKHIGVNNTTGRCPACGEQVDSAFDFEKNIGQEMAVYVTFDIDEDISFLQDFDAVVLPKFDSETVNEKQIIEKLRTLVKTNHLLTCLAEECGEVMELMYLEPDAIEKIELEINDIVAVAHLLRDKDILCSQLNPRTLINSRLLKRENTREIFTCVKDIQYFTHKAIRFGLEDTKPNSQRRNRDELEFLLNKLVGLVCMDNKINLWEDARFDDKINKVLRYLDYSMEKKS